MLVTRMRGDTIPDSFTVSGTKTRGPVNLTGSSFKLTLSSIENPVDTTTQLYQLDGVMDDPESGIVTFAPTAAQADLVGLFYYDVQMLDTYGKVHTLVKDVYQYVQDITK